MTQSKSRGSFIFMVELNPQRASDRGMAASTCFLLFKTSLLFFVFSERAPTTQSRRQKVSAGGPRLYFPFTSSGDLILLLSCFLSSRGEKIIDILLPSRTFDTKSGGRRRRWKAISLAGFFNFTLLNFPKERRKREREENLGEMELGMAEKINRNAKRFSLQKCSKWQGCQRACMCVLQRRS